MKPFAEVNLNPPRGALRGSFRLPPWSPSPSRLRGFAYSFTLIEVVVALTLGVTLLVAVQGLLVNAYRAADEIERRATNAATRMLPFNLLRQDLENQPAGGGLALSNNVLRLTTLNALQSSRLAARHAVGVQYTVEPSRDRAYRLIRRENELGRRNRKRPGVIIADAISEVSFAVYDGQQWRDRWPPRVARTAYAVRITVIWPNNEQRQQTVSLAPLRWSRHDE